MTAPSADEPWDDGLQNERTTLSWVRTSLSLLGAGALVAKQTPVGALAIALLVSTVVVAGTMIAASERRHHARGEALRAGDPIGALRHLLLTTAAATFISSVAAVIVIW